MVGVHYIPESQAGIFAYSLLAVSLACLEGSALTFFLLSGEDYPFLLCVWYGLGQQQGVLIFAFSFSSCCSGLEPEPLTSPFVHNVLDFLPALQEKEKPPLNLVGNVNGKIAVIVDDIIDDVDDYVTAAELLHSRGAYKVGSHLHFSINHAAMEASCELYLLRKVVRLEYAFPRIGKNPTKAFSLWLGRDKMFSFCNVSWNGYYTVPHYGEAVTYLQILRFQ